MAPLGTWRWPIRMVQARLCSAAGGSGAFPPTVMSGIQPTGVPHLGNYLGAIRPWARLQGGDGRLFVGIVDLHALTQVAPVGGEEATTLDRRVLEMAASLVACGIDPAATVLFQQSRVRGHTELAWLLSCLCSLPAVQHQPQWRERLETWPAARLSVGLLTYPVLQAADVLLYRATHVPVGEDQIKHLELTRHLADRFHARFCPSGRPPVFPRPKTVLPESEARAARVCSLRQPDKKMSKSQADADGRIDLTDSEDAVRRKVKRAVTDSEPGPVTYDPAARPGVANLLRIEAALSGRALAEVCAEAAAWDKLQLKERVANTVVAHLGPMRRRYEALLDDEAALRAMLDDGNRRAQEVADRTLGEVAALVHGR